MKHYNKAMTVMLFAVIPYSGSLFADNIIIIPHDFTTAVNNVKWSCHGDYLRVDAVLANKNDSPKTYDVKFTGIPNCRNCAINVFHPALRPSSPVVTNGTPVTVAAHGEKVFTVNAPGNVYLDGSTVSAKMRGGAVWVSAGLKPVPTDYCHIVIH